MKFTAAVLAGLFCAEAVLAAVPAERSHGRALSRHKGGPRRMGGNKTIKHATVQSNWGGAILEASGFSAVSAVANVPRGGGGSNAAGTAWVGIDGNDCETAILQTGFDWYGDGTYDAWYEWWPEDSSSFSGITIAEGDDIQMSVVATSKTSGIASLENLTTGQKVSKTFSNVRSGSLCLTDAEFIIEDFEECQGNNCQFVPFASFSPAVEFSQCSVTANGRSVSLNSATISEVVINNRAITSCSVSGSTVTCSYM
ncbi:Scytalidopepsin B [Xylogone sp. PMI_703]|nr:Scytalidopepsin B [Xylogone sp. PMI_703]